MGKESKGTCKHARLKYSSDSGVVYCVKCKAEWRNDGSTGYSAYSWGDWNPDFSLADTSWVEIR